MPTTDEALDKKRKEVQALRDEIAAAGDERNRLLQEKENDSTAAALDAEKANLQIQLKQAHEEVTALGGDPSAIKVPVKRGASDTSTTAATKTDSSSKSGGEG